MTSIHDSTDASTTDLSWTVQQLRRQGWTDTEIARAFNVRGVSPAPEFLWTALAIGLRFQDHADFGEESK